ncbi:hypothetical protein ACTXKB_09350 [Psychrobacter aquimaris]|uniref:hypothetical protein n=1 Tax=Psychrobacter aquimaris TaxID=292733 RepID=UPI003FD30F66
MGWASAFWLVTLLGIIAFVGLFWRLPTLPISESIALRKKMSLLLDRQVLVILLVSLLAAIASLGMYTFLAPFMTLFIMLILAWSLILLPFIAF